MNDQEALEDLGLTPAEGRVYTALLRLGSSTIGPIIRQSGLHSSVVYNSMQHLFEKGLASYTTKGRIKHFAAANPAQLIEIAKEKENNIRQALPGLEAIMNSARNSQTVFIFEGPKAARTVFNDILHTLKRGDEQLVVGVSESDSGLGDFVRRWNEKRVREGIKKRVLITENEKKWISYYRKQSLSRIRVLPSTYDIKMSINVYGNKALLILWGKYPIYILIDRAEVADNFRKYFNLMWSISR